MLRTVVGNAVRAVRLASQPNMVPRLMFSSFLTSGRGQTAAASLILPKPAFVTCAAPGCPTTNLLSPAPGIQQQTSRTVTKFSLRKGKRKSVKAVIKRFKRLHWGAWIRTHTGRHKKMFKKSAALKRRLRQHIFTNATQSWLLDKMVTNFWRRPKHYIDDPYEPYHKRDEYFATKSKTFKV